MHCEENVTGNRTAHCFNNLLTSIHHPSHTSGPHTAQQMPYLSYTHTRARVRTHTHTHTSCSLSVSGLYIFEDNFIKLHYFKHTITLCFLCMHYFCNYHYEHILLISINGWVISEFMLKLLISLWIKSVINTKQTFSSVSLSKSLNGRKITPKKPTQNHSKLTLRWPWNKPN